MSELPYGHAPLHRALTEPLLTAGLPDNFAVSLWVAVAAFAIILHQVWALPIGVVVHLVCALVTRADTHFFLLVRPALLARRRLEP
jgi:type IV secretory pathway VirB3-like protein